MRFVESPVHPSTVTTIRTRQGARSARGEEAAAELRFPAASVVLVTGVPGAGKSTLLRSLYASGERILPERVGEVRVLDSAQVRDRWAAVQTVPYRLWRPFVHLAHYARVLAAIARGGPIVVHDCGTRSWVRRLIGIAAARHGLQVHLVMLDVSEREAWRGQGTRGRAVRFSSFATHCRRWADLMAAALRAPEDVMPGVASVTVLDRPAARQLRAIRFS